MQNMRKFQNKEELDQAIQDIDDQIPEHCEKGCDPNKLRQTLKMLDSHTRYDEKTLEEQFGGEFMKSIEHETDVRIDLPSRPVK